MLEDDGDPRIVGQGLGHPGDDRALVALDVDLDDIDRRFADDGVDGGHLHDDPFAAPDLTGGDQSVPPGLGGVDRQLVLPGPVGARRLHHHHLAQPVAGDVVGEDRVVARLGLERDHAAGGSGEQGRQNGEVADIGPDIDHGGPGGDEGFQHSTGRGFVTARKQLAADRVHPGEAGFVQPHGGGRPVAPHHDNAAITTQAKDPSDGGGDATMGRADSFSGEVGQARQRARHRLTGDLDSYAD